MNTMTKCFMLMALAIVCVAMLLIAIPTNIYFHNWWMVALDIVLFALSALNIRIAYKRAKEFEETILSAIHSLQLDALASKAASIHGLISAIREMAEKNEQEKENEDELESDKPATEGAGE